MLSLPYCQVFLLTHLLVLLQKNLSDYVVFIIADAAIRMERMAERNNNNLQWYGDQISFSPDIVEMYKMNFENNGVPYGIVDTSKFNENQSFRHLIKLIQTNILEK